MTDRQNQPAEATFSDEEARQVGLSSPSYLLLIHSLKTGAVTQSFLDAVKEIFTHDREILRLLAK
jgi:hypothetical protein